MLQLKRFYKVPAIKVISVLGQAKGIFWEHYDQLVFGCSISESVKIEFWEITAVGVSRRKKQSESFAHELITPKSDRDT